MTFLVDTNVISGARRKQSPPSTWLAPVRASDIHLSVITIGEIVQGVALKSRRDEAAAAVIRAWLGTLRRRYSDRILPVSEAVATAWGELAAMRPRPVADGLIAATALVHDLVVVTHNVRDFESTGVRVLNPWSPP